MRITLNLATRPFADLGPAIKRLRIAMAVLVVLAIGLGLGLRAFHQKAEEARARDHSLDGQIARINQERQGYQDLMRQPANAQLLLQAEALNRLIEEKTFSWTLAMEDLETVLPGGVQVSTIEPVRAKDGHIILNLHVIGPRDRAVELVRNLEHSKRFLMPRIVGENSETTGGPGEKLQAVSASNRVNFELRAEYNPATLEERKAAEKHSRAAENSGSQLAPALNAAQSTPGPASSPAQHPNRPPYNGASKPNSPRAVSPQPAPPQPEPPQSGNSSRRPPRQLSRQGRNHSNDPDAAPGGPQ
jgi:type IV pilus assembly protein PilN